MVLLHFLEVWRLPNENDYIKRHEFERSQGKLYERINQTDRALTELSGKVDKQNALQQKSFESQERQEKSLERIVDGFDSFKEDFNGVKYEVKGHGLELERINKSIGDKQRWNVGIISAIIAGITTLLAGALQLAPLIFK